MSSSSLTKMIPRLTAGLTTRVALPSLAFFSSMAFSNPSPKQLVDETISNNSVVIFSKSWCQYCRRVKGLFASEFPDVKPTILELDQREDGSAIQSYLVKKTGQRTVPSVFVNKKHIGGDENTQAAFKSGQLAKLLSSKP